MGILDFINSTTKAAKRNAPDPTAVKDACKTSYGYFCAAVVKIDNAVRVKGIQRLNGCMRDEGTRSLISLFALKFAKNAALKMIPGAQVLTKIISETINDVKSENHRQIRDEGNESKDEGNESKSQEKGNSGIFDQE